MNGIPYLKRTPLNSNVFENPAPLIKRGTYTLNGDGVTKTFNIPHGLGKKPSFYIATTRSYDTASIPMGTQCDETNIVLLFKEPLPVGTHTLNWFVEE